MDSWQHEYIVLLGLLTATFLGTGIYSWWRRLLPGADALVGIAICSAIWTCGYILELHTSNQDIKVAWAKAQLAGIVFVPVAWLVFAMCSSGRLTRRGLGILQALTSVPILMLVLMFTNKWHNLIWLDLQPVVGPGDMLRLGYGPGAWGFVCFAIGITTFASLFWIQQARHSTSLLARQRVALAIGSWLGWLGISLGLINLPRLDRYDLSVMLLIGGTLLVTWALMHSYALTLINLAYHSTVASLQHGVIVLDAQNRIVEINPAAARAFALDAVGLRGQRAEMLFENTPARSLLTSKDEAHITITAPHNSAVSYNLHLIPLVSRHKTISGRLILVRDVTALKRGEEQQSLLIDASRLLTLGLDDEVALPRICRLIVPRFAEWCLLYRAQTDHVAPRIALAFADDTRQAWIDELYEQGFFNHRSRQDILTLLRHEHPELLPELPEALLAVLSEDEQHPLLIRGQQESMLISVPLIARGRWLGLLVLGTTARQFAVSEHMLAMDLGNRIALAVDNANMLAGVRASEEAALNSARAKLEFLANFSHEIRTTMSAVVSATDLLQHTSLDPKQLGLVDIVRRGGGMLLDIVSTTLDFSKIEAGKLEFNNVHFNLRSVIEDVLQIVASKAGEKQIDLSYSIAADVPEWLVADAARLRQIMVNLLSNAVRFTDQGEIVVSATARVIPADRVEVQIAVADTGIGIPLESIDQLFQPFSQIATHRVQNAGGTGLGLAISKRLSELLGGTMSVVSKEGYGSTFTFSFVAVPSPEQAVDPLARTQPTLVGKRALIVGKRTMALHTLRLQLQSWGMQVQQISGRAEMFDRMHRDEHFDIALIGVSLKTDQALLAMLLETYPCLSSIPVIRLGWFGGPETDDGLIKVYTTLYQPIVRHVLHAALVSALDQIEPPITPVREQIDLRDSLRVLVADDNTTNQILALGYLMLLNHHADVVDDGKAVLEAVSRRCYDIVLLDLQMPKMSGIEVVQAIRKDIPESNQPYVIGVTASALGGDRERCLEAGMNDYISKPMRLETLSKAIERYSACSKRGWLPAGCSAGESPRSEKVVPRAMDTPRTGPVLPEIEVIDSEGLQGLNQVLGTKYPSLASSIVEHYLEDAVQLISQMRAAIMDADIPALGSAAHKLKSSSAIVGAMHLASLCNQLERYVREGARMDWAARMDEIEAEFERARVHLGTVSRKATDRLPPEAGATSRNGR